MVSEKLLMTQNYKEIEQANKLGIPAPEPKQTFAKLLFHSEDVKRAVIDGDKIMIDFYDEESYSLGFDKELWDKLEQFFIDND